MQRNKPETSWYWYASEAALVLIVALILLALLTGCMSYRTETMHVQSIGTGARTLLVMDGSNTVAISHSDLPATLKAAGEFVGVAGGTAGSIILKGKP
jgi:hypothetical protein